MMPFSWVFMEYVRKINEWVELLDCQALGTPPPSVEHFKINVKVELRGQLVVRDVLVEHSFQTLHAHVCIL